MVGKTAIRKTVTRKTVTRKTATGKMAKKNRMTNPEKTVWDGTQMNLARAKTVDEPSSRRLHTNKTNFGRSHDSRTNEV